MRPMKKVTLKDKTFRIAIPYEDISKAMDQVADKINADFRGCEDIPVLLCVLNGSIMFMGELMKRINFNCQTISIKLTSYEGTNTTGKVKQAMGLTADLTGRRVIVVEDIVDSGNTIVELKRILEEKEAAESRVCTLLLKPEAYYDPKNKALFEAMLDLFNERSPIDMLTVIERLRQKKTLEEVGGPGRIAALTQKVATGANVDYYAHILQQKAIQRNLIEASYGILKDAFDPSVTVDDLVTTAQDSVYNAISGNLKNPYKHVSEVINYSMERIERSQHSTGVTGVHSGFHKVDQFTMGWQPGNLIILGARPSVGKTAFALNLARNAAVEFNEPVGFFSLEMTSMELLDRLIATESGISSDKLKGKIKILPDEWQVLEQSVSSLDSLISSRDGTLQRRNLL